MNKAILVGRLGKDPEFKQINPKTSVCKFSIATNSKGKSHWHNIVVWGKSAEICDKYLRTGSMVGVDGEIQTRSYETKSGEKKYITEIHTFSINLMGKSDQKVEKQEAFDNFGTEAKKDEEIPF